MTQKARQLTPKASPTPEGLAEAGSSLWVAVTNEWTLRADEELLLLEACRTVDELELLHEALTASPLLTEGAKGQNRTHPIFQEIRAHRLALKQLLKYLGLSEAAVDPAERALQRSEHGRKLARARWGPRG